MQEITHNQTDAELVELAKNSQNNFRYIIDRYEKPLARYIYRISNFSTEDMEDILQEVFINVYKNLNDYDPKLKFSSWIYRITHNQVINHYRRSKARPQSYSPEVNEVILETMFADFNLEDDVEKALNKDLLLQLLNKIDIKYKEIIVLRYFEEKNYNEISDILKKPKGTVATLLNRAKKKLLEQYEQSKG